MKKFLVVLVLMLGTMIDITQAQRYEMYSTHLSVDNGQWKPCSVNVLLDLDEDQVVIHSAEVQIIDIYDLETVEGVDRGLPYLLFRCLATDTNWVKCRLDMYFYDKGTIIFKMNYNDVVYKYKLRKYM